jgi:hypothetical protein
MAFHSFSNKVSRLELGINRTNFLLTLTIFRFYKEMHLLKKYVSVITKILAIMIAYLNRLFMGNIFCSGSQLHLYDSFNIQCQKPCSSLVNYKAISSLKYSITLKRLAHVRSAINLLPRNFQ